MKSTNVPLLKAMNGKEFSLLKRKKEGSSFFSNLCGLLGVGKEITKYMGSPSLIKSVGKEVEGVWGDVVRKNFNIK